MKKFLFIQLFIFLFCCVGCSKSNTAEIQWETLNAEVVYDEETNEYIFYSVCPACENKVEMEIAEPMGAWHFCKNNSCSFYLERGKMFRHVYRYKCKMLFP